MIIVDCIIERFGNSLYIGYTPKFKGLVVHGKTIPEIIKELIISIKVKMAYDYDLDISKIQGKELKSLDDIEVSQGATDTEYKFDLAI